MFHSNVIRPHIVPVKLSPLVRNMSVFVAMNCSSKDLPWGLSEVMFH